MDKLTAIQALAAWDKKGRYVFTKCDLAKLFPNDSPKTFAEGLSRLVKNKLIQRACRGIYLNKQAVCFDQYVLRIYPIKASNRKRIASL